MVSIALMLMSATMTAGPLPPIRTLLITGVNNHNWQYSSRLHADTLEATGRFAVDITDSPEAVLGDPKKLSGYSLFVMDYNDYESPQRWNETSERNFVAAVKNGAGVVAIHSANNAFKGGGGWSDYEKMLGLLWREGTGHGKVHEFAVEFVDSKHPVTAGLAGFTTNDELYHKLVNTQKSEYHLLARAMSSKERGGTGEFEPMAFTLEFGKGRVFATPLGHVWTGAIETKTSITSNGFKSLVARGAEWAATGAVTLPAEWKDIRTHNVLTAEEKAAGWTLLFDGTNPPAMKGWKSDGVWPPKGWELKDGTIHRPGADLGPGSRDLITNEQFGDFEFSVEWKIAPGGNSGIMYRCSEEFDFPWRTGPEMQILDNAKHQDGKDPKTSAGALYAIKAPAFDVARPAGEWNHAVVIAKGTSIQHWLNGLKIVDVDLTSDEYKTAHDASKWKSMPEMGTKAKGVIALQDHGDEVWFRNVKVRRLDGTK
jgi:type 1 glutamine amidotransferase